MSTTMDISSQETIPVNRTEGPAVAEQEPLEAAVAEQEPAVPEQEPAVPEQEPAVPEQEPAVPEQEPLESTPPFIFSARAEASEDIAEAEDIAEDIVSTKSATKTNNLPDNTACRDPFYVYSMNRWKRKDAKHDLEAVIDKPAFPFITNNINIGLPCSSVNSCNTEPPLVMSEDAFAGVATSEENNFFDIVKAETIRDTNLSFKDYLKTRLPSMNTAADLNTKVSDIPFVFQTGYYRTEDAGSRWHNDAVPFVQLQQYNVLSFYLNTGSEKKNTVVKNINGQNLIDWGNLNNACIVEDFDGGHFKQACKSGDITDAEVRQLHYLFGNVTENDPAGKADSTGKLNADFGPKGIILNTWIENSNSNGLPIDRENVHFYGKYQVPPDIQGKPNMWSFFHSAYDIKIQGNLEKKCLKASKFKTNIEFTCPFINRYAGNPFTIQDSGVNNSNAKVIDALTTLNKKIEKSDTDEDRNNRIFELNTRVQGKNSGDVLQGLFCATSFDCNFSQIDGNGKLMNPATILPNDNKRYVLTHDTVLLAYCLRMGINALFTMRDASGTKLYIFSNELLSTGREMWEILFEKYTGPASEAAAAEAGATRPLSDPYRKGLFILTQVLDKYTTYKQERIALLTNELSTLLGILDVSISDLSTNDMPLDNQAKKQKLEIPESKYGAFSVALLNVIKTCNKLGDFNLINVDVIKTLNILNVYNSSNPIIITKDNVLQLNRAYEDANAIFKLFYAESLETIQTSANSAEANSADAIIAQCGENITTYFNNQINPSGLLEKRAGYLATNDWVWSRRISKRVNVISAIFGGKNNNVVDYALMLNAFQHLNVEIRRSIYELIVRLPPTLLNPGMREEFKVNTNNLTTEIIKRLNQGDLFNEVIQPALDEQMIHYIHSNTIMSDSLNSSSKIVEGYTELFNKDAADINEDDIEADYVLEGGSGRGNGRVKRERGPKRDPDISVLYSDSMSVFNPQSSLDDDAIIIVILNYIVQNTRPLRVDYSRDVLAYRLRPLSIFKTATRGGGLTPELADIQFDLFMVEFNTYTAAKKYKALRMLSSDICNKNGHDLFICFIIIQQLQIYIENVSSENNDVDLIDEIMTVQFLKNIIDKIFLYYQEENLSFETLYKISVMSMFLNNLFLFGNASGFAVDENRLNTIAYVIKRCKVFAYSNEDFSPSKLAENADDKVIIEDFLTTGFVEDDSINVADELANLYKLVSDKIMEDNDVRTYVSKDTSLPNAESLVSNTTLEEILKVDFPELYNIRTSLLESFIEQFPEPLPELTLTSTPSPSFTTTPSPSPSPKSPLDPWSRSSNRRSPGAKTPTRIGGRYTKKNKIKLPKFTKKNKGRTLIKHKLTRGKKSKQNKQTKRKVSN